METIPSQQELGQASNRWPSFMNPGMVPSAVVLPNILGPQACDDIVQYMIEEHKPYTAEGCNATTRQILGKHEVFEDLEYAAHYVNNLQFDFDLYDVYACWMQEYGPGGDYHMHTDAAPGQMRKMTAVLLLSEHDDYTGGMLQVEVDPRLYDVPRGKGTVVVFPSWVRHRVTPVESGLRRTINMGFWGPAFR